MAILKHFPPSDKIVVDGWGWDKQDDHYCRPMTEEEEILLAEYLWKTRHAVVKWKEIHPSKDR